MWVVQQPPTRESSSLVPIPSKNEDKKTLSNRRMTTAAVPQTSRDEKVSKNSREESLRR